MSLAAITLAILAVTFLQDASARMHPDDAAISRNLGMALALCALAFAVIGMFI